MIDEYVISGGKKLRMGITTGTCAALAAQGAVRMLLTGARAESAVLVTPRGIRVDAPLLDISLGPDAASCAVRKDAGDDKDATDGMLIYARAEFLRDDGTGPACGGTGEEDAGSRNADRVIIDGGEGVGRVTLPGLDQPVGAAAINSVPRKMIRDAVCDAAGALGYVGQIRITIFAPCGTEIAKKTFNPRLGIEGGISILGTSGIVEPMSLAALTESISLEIRQKAALGLKRLILTPGNYGLAYLTGWAAERGIDRAEVPVVMCSNFIGEALDEAGAHGFADVLLVGHIGKLVKLAGGIMNTHSRMADCRTELICAHAAVCGAHTDVCRSLMQAATTDACIDLLKQNGLYEAVTESLLLSIDKHLQYRSADTCRVGAVLFSNVHGFIGETAGVRRMLEDWTA